MEISEDIASNEEEVVVGEDFKSITYEQEEEEEEEEKRKKHSIKIIGMKKELF
uniref:Uncharacterized protein n=1 Tax=Romanomermis culicivorax TaxID=13658 RepID=A0A915KX68_ROMCU